MYQKYVDDLQEVAIQLRKGVEPEMQSQTNFVRLSSIADPPLD